MGLLDLLFKRGSTNNALIDPNFRGSMEFYTPHQPVFTPKNYETFVREGYRKTPTLFACINKISSSAGGIKWKLYTDKSEEKEIKEHASLDLWSNPNPRLKGHGALVETIFGYWHMSGNSYLWSFRDKGGKGQPLALWPMRPDRMKAVVGNGDIENYVYGYGTRNPQILELPDVMHLKFPAYDDDVYGLSPIEIASYYAQQNNEAMSWNTALMQNMGRPSSVFMAQNYLTTEQRNQIRQELKRRFSSKINAGMPLILEADMKWQNMSLSPLELDWLKSREQNTRDMAAIFDVAPELIGDSAGKTFANVAEARQALYIENVLPKMDRLRDYLNSWYLPMWDDLPDTAYMTYDVYDIEALASIFQAEKKQELSSALEQWNNGGIMLNEYREVIGREPVDAGNCFKFGQVLVSEESLEKYADQSLQAPANPPMPLPEPLNVPAPVPGQPAQNQKKPDDNEKMFIELLYKAFLAYQENKRVDNYSKTTIHEESNLHVSRLPASTGDDRAAQANATFSTRQYDLSTLIVPDFVDMTADIVPINITTTHTTNSNTKASKNAYRQFMERYT